jgi:SAM-dependent methyltransferase
MVFIAYNLCSMDDMTSSHSEQSFHEELYGEIDEGFLNRPVFSGFRKRMICDFLRLANLSHDSEVLSIGCGAGLWEGILAGYVKCVVGLDISVNAVERARTRCSAIHNVSFNVLDVTIQGDALPENGFDAVCLFGFLHHIPDAVLPAVLTTLARTLRPGGIVYSFDPSQRRLIGRFKRLVRSTYAHFHSPDERELDARELERWYADSGFQVLIVKWVDFFTIPIAYLFPNAPSWAITPLSALDRLLLKVPYLRNFASSFTILARSVKA